MNNGDVRQHLEAYLDGELSPDMTAAVEQALSGSPELCEELARWRSLRLAARRIVTEGRVAPQVKDGLRRRLINERLRGRRRAAAWTLAVSGIAAAVLLVVQFRNAPFVQRWMGSNPAAAPVVLSSNSFALVFHACGMKKIDGAEHAGEAPDVLRKSLQGSEPFKVLVPNLNGYQIAGMCQCFRDSGVNVVAVHYYGPNVSPNRVTVFSVDRKFELSPPKTAPPHAHRQRYYELASADTVSVLTWDERGGHFALCGEADGQALERLADSVTVTEMRVDPSSLALADFLIGSPAIRP